VRNIISHPFIILRAASRFSPCRARSLGFPFQRCSPWHCLFYPPPAFDSSWWPSPPSENIVQPILSPPRNPIHSIFQVKFSLLVLYRTAALNLHYFESTTLEKPFGWCLQDKDTFQLSGSAALPGFDRTAAPQERQPLSLFRV